MREEGRKEENRKEWHMEKRRNNMRRGWDEEFNKVVTNTTPAYENKSKWWTLWNLQQQKSNHKQDECPEKKITGLIWTYVFINNITYLL